MIIEGKQRTNKQSDKERQTQRKRYFKTMRKTHRIEIIRQTEKESDIKIQIKRR